MIKKLLITLLLISPLLGQDDNVYQDEYRAFTYTLKAYDTEYKVAMQLMGVYPEVSPMSITYTAELLDVAVWIWGKPETTHYIEAIDPTEALYEILPLCERPYVETFHLKVRQHGLINHYFIYASSITEGMLDHIFYTVSNENIARGVVYVTGCVEWADWVEEME